MEKWQIHFHDQQHDVKSFVENHFDTEEAEQAFQMTIDGVVFAGDSLDDWELVDSEKRDVLEAAQQKFALLCYGSAEAGYTYWLQDHTLTLTIPTIVFAVDRQSRIDAELTITLASVKNTEQTGSIYVLDGEKVWPDHSVCQAVVLTVGAERFAASELSPFWRSLLGISAHSSAANIISAIVLAAAIQITALMGRIISVRCTASVSRRTFIWR